MNFETFSPEACFSSKLRKKIVFELKSIEHAALSMVTYYTRRDNMSFFIILNFLKSLPFYILYFAIRKKNFCSILWQYDFVNGEIGSFL